MSKELILVGCNSITSTAEDIFRETELQGLDQEAHEVVQNMVDSLGIEQREVAATREDTQYVLQEQMLVLGDARTGKTSTVKALIGQEFKANQENETKGVEFKYVNQEWKTLDLQDMQFGNSVLRFVEDVEIEKASWPPTHDQRRITIRNEYKSLFKNLYRSVEAIGIYLWLFRVLVFFTISLIIRNQIISSSSSLKFAADFLLKGLFYAILSHRFFYLAANYQRTSLIYLLVFFLLHSCSYFFTANLSTGDCQLRMESIFETPILFGKVFKVRHLLFIPSILIILPYFFMIAAALLPITGDRKVRYPQLIEIQYKLMSLFLLHLRVKADSLFDILITLSTITTTFLFELTSLIHYSTPSTHGCFIFILHLFLLHQQKILLKWYTGAALALEFAIILQLYLFVLDSKMQLILFYVILLCVGAALHIYGRLPEVNAAAEVRITAFRRITDFRRDPTVCTIAIFKFSPNMQKLKANFSKLKIKILDFAGDEEYYAYHQIFLNSNAIYAVVFNIQECIKDNFKEIESKVRSLRFWLESIHSHVLQGTPIFLVGTHRGDIEMDTLREINTHINDAVGHFFIDEIVLNEKDDLMFFHVENSRGLNDNGVISLRRKISSVAEEELKDFIGQEIPLSWIIVQDSIIRYQENHERPVCVTVRDFKEAFDPLTWSEKMLNYLHNKGFIIHADKSEGLSKWVLLNPNVLVQILILLISQPEELTKKRGLSKHWIVLKKSGMLTKDLLEFIIFHTFMEEYDLICPLKDPFCDMQHLQDIKQTTHFVPSLLPAAPGQAMWLESSEDAKFYIFFDSYVPEAFFFRLLSRSCKSSHHGMESYVPEIYRDSGVFFFSQQIYRLRLMKDEGLIEVTLTKPMGFLKPFDILLAIAIRVEDIRSRDFQNVFFHCGPACSSPTCPGSRTDSMSLLTDRPRRHVHNVYPACKQKGPKCFNDFFKCQNVFRVEDAEIWKPPPSNRGPMEALR